MFYDGKILIGRTDDGREINIYPQMANRHGLIAGATGTGKTVTLKVMAEAFSDMGVPVFLADAKGDLSGMCDKPAETSEDMAKRCAVMPDYPVFTCGVCGKRYPLHPWSAATGAPCPYCLDRLKSKVDGKIPPMDVQRIIQKRMDRIYPGGYVVIGGTDIRNARVRHKVCGATKGNVHSYIWGEKRECQECRNTSIRKVQSLADASGGNFRILNVKKEKSYRKIIFMHECGRTFDISSNRFMKKPYCPYCDNRTGFRDLEEVFPEYEVMTSYRTSLDMVTVKHTECGTLFRTTKAVLLNGKKCPVCEDKNDMDTVKRIVAEYAPDYTLSAAKSTGAADIFYKGKLLKKNVRLVKIMNDLKSDVPVLLTERKRQYCPELSLKRRILDSVRRATAGKGYWTYADGIDGETEITQRMRKTVWKLNKYGILVKIKNGRYCVSKEVFYDSNHSTDY